MNELITVYIPTHNRSELLNKAVNSVLNQTYNFIELIICDDGSTDNTKETVLEIINKNINSNIRIKYLKNESPKGACFSRNRCISEATGKYITGLDDDDLFTSDRLEVFLTESNKHASTFLCSNILLDDGVNIEPGPTFSGLINHSMMRERNHIGNQIFILTENIKALGGFDEKFPAWQDYELWFRLTARFGPCLRIKNATYIMNIEIERVRITTGSKSHKGFKMFLDKHSGDLSLSNRKNLFIQDKMNRGELVCFYDVLKNLTLNNIFFFAKQELKKIKILTKINRSIKKLKLN